MDVYQNCLGPNLFLIDNISRLTPTDHGNRKEKPIQSQHFLDAGLWFSFLLYWLRNEKHNTYTFITTSQYFKIIFSSQNTWPKTFTSHVLPGIPYQTQHSAAPLRLAASVHQILPCWGQPHKPATSNFAVLPMILSQVATGANYTSQCQEWLFKMCGTI